MPPSLASDAPRDISGPSPWLPAKEGGFGAPIGKLPGKGLDGAQPSPLPSGGRREGRIGNA